MGILIKRSFSFFVKDNHYRVSFEIKKILGKRGLMDSTKAHMYITVLDVFACSVCLVRYMFSTYKIDIRIDNLNVEIICLSPFHYHGCC